MITYLKWTKGKDCLSQSLLLISKEEMSYLYIIVILIDRKIAPILHKKSVKDQKMIDEQLNNVYE